MTGRGRRGRRIARLLLAVVIAIDAVTAALVLLAVSNSPGPMVPPPGPLTAVVVIAIGVALNVVGLVWMLRISEDDPEAHPTSWRATRR